jgi:hypothetical protein
VTSVDGSIVNLVDFNEKIRFFILFYSVVPFLFCDALNLSSYVLVFLCWSRVILCLCSARSVIESTCSVLVRRHHLQI